MRRKRTGVPPAHSLQPLAPALVQQKLGSVHGPLEGVPQKLAPEFPVHAPVPLVRGVRSPAHAPEFLLHEGGRPVQGGEFSRRAPEFLRLEAPAGRAG